MFAKKFQSWTVRILPTWRGIHRNGVWKTAVLRFFTGQPIPSRQGWRVSSHGRICNSRVSISFGSLHPDGYKIVNMLGQVWKVHRIVKITFDGLPKSDEAWQVHHIDGDRANNRLDNLEYATQSENVRHSYSSPSRRNSGPAQSKPVLWRPVGCKNWTTSPSSKAAAQQLGLHQSTVSVCCRKNCTAGGCEFRLLNISQ